MFPLRTVLFPGMPLPLHVFEERYRALFRELLAAVAPHRFGVVGIRAGREVGDPRTEWYDVGCLAEVGRVDRLPDGRLDLVATGVSRFRLLRCYPAGEYPTAEVQLLGEPLGDRARAGLLAERVTGAFRNYLLALGATQRAEISPPELPTEPLLLSYLVASTAAIPMSDRQGLLAAANVADRLRLELRLLARETTLLRRLSAPPALDVVRVQPSQN
jgi:Lon protease-like protein